MQLDVTLEDLDRVDRSALVFDTGKMWILRRPGGAWLFDFFTPRSRDVPCRSVWMNPELSEGKISLDLGVYGHLKDVDPYEAPIPEILVILKLARHAGVELHACGIRDEKGRGILFVGRSGDGKTTTARLWGGREGITILSDDRIIVKQETGSLVAWGTPWHGEGQYAENLGVPLSAIFLVEHGATTQAIPVPEVEAVAGMLPRCFPPFHDRSGMEHVLEMLSLIARSVPCFRLPFVPDQSAVDVVRRTVESLP